MNITNYIKIHQDEDFREFPLTEVDSLIFSLIPYIDFKEVIPAFYKNKLTLNEVAMKLDVVNSKDTNSFFIRNTYKMFKLMQGTKRYGNIYLYNYMNIVNAEMQFGALTLKLPDKSIFIAFAGTDASIIGFYEDFKMAYLYPGASQKYASIYLKKAIRLTDKIVRIGGHSKGGNLAISAAMNARFYIRYKINSIWNFDGPGFLKEQVNSKEYQRISSKINFYVPSDSIIGMLLYHQDKYTVVKSKGFHILQHDAFNWFCDEKSFLQDSLSKRSKNLEIKLTKKLEEIPIDNRLTIISNLFLLFKNNNISNTKNLTITNIIKIVKDFKNLDKETQNTLSEFLLILLLK